jgi:hypothetical protein
MSTDRTNDTDTGSSDGFEDGSDDGAARVPGAGDDEGQNRKQIAETGEPQRDALGNADGAS